MPTSTSCSRWSRRACSASRTGGTGCWRRSGSTHSSDSKRGGRGGQAQRGSTWNGSLCSLRMLRPISRSGDPRPWLERIERERGNLRAALQDPAAGSVSRSSEASTRRSAWTGFWFLRGETRRGAAVARRGIGRTRTGGLCLRAKALPSAIMIDLYQGSADVADGSRRNCRSSPAASMPVRRRRPCTCEGLSLRFEEISPRRLPSTRSPWNSLMTRVTHGCCHRRSTISATAR